MSMDQVESPPTQLGPVPESSRIRALDVARGFALLGIFLVNIESFSQPLGEFMRTAPPPDATFAETVAFYFVKVLCEGKFYPLFSMLFGIGFALQFDRAVQANRRFIGVGLRRLGILFLFGVTHALAFWYGDVLHLYAVTGVLLLLLIKCRARTLLIIASILLIIGIIGAGVIALLVGATPPPPPMRDPPPHFDDPFGTLWKALANEKLNDGPAAPLWIQTESQVYREGPYLQLFLFRMMTWLIMAAFEMFGSFLFIGALFLFGAAMLKSGVFDPGNVAIRRRLFLVGITLGLPCSIAAAIVMQLLPTTAGRVVAGLLTAATGPLLSLAYLMGWSLVVDFGWWPRLTSAMANAGRMALTNYLSQTVIATTIFYFYGFALFGRTTGPQRLGIVFAVYAMQLVLSSIWLQFFRFGPMEWLWRTLTYGQLQPFVKRPMLEVRAV